MASRISAVRLKIKQVQQLRVQYAEQQGQHTQLMKQLEEACGAKTEAEAQTIIEEYNITLQDNDEILADIEVQLDEILEKAQESA